MQARKRQMELRESPAYRSALAAIRALDRALEAAADEDASHLRHALADARKALGAHLEERGASLPKANLPKGPRPRPLGDEDGSKT